MAEEKPIATASPLPEDSLPRTSSSARGRKGEESGKKTVMDSMRGAFRTTFVRSANYLGSGFKKWVGHQPGLPTFRTYLRHAHFHKSYPGILISFVFYAIVVYVSFAHEVRSVKGLVWVFTVIFFAIMQLLLRFLVLHEKETVEPEDLMMKPLRPPPNNTMITRLLTLELYEGAEEPVKRRFRMMRTLVFRSIVFISICQILLVIAPPTYYGIHCGTSNDSWCHLTSSYVNLYGAAFGAAMALGIGVLTDTAIALFLLISLHQLQMANYKQELKKRRLMADEAVAMKLEITRPEPSEESPPVGIEVDAKEGSYEPPIKEKEQDDVTLLADVSAAGTTPSGNVIRRNRVRGLLQRMRYTDGRHLVLNEDIVPSLGPLLFPEQVVSEVGEEFRFLAKPCRNVFEEYLRIQALVGASSYNWAAPLLIWFICVVIIFSVNLYIILSDGHATTANALNIVELIIALGTFLVPFLFAVFLNSYLTGPLGLARRSKPTDYMAVGGRDALCNYFESNPIIFNVYGIPLTRSYLVGFVTTSGIGIVVAWVKFLGS